MAELPTSEENGGRRGPKRHSDHNSLTSFLGGKNKVQFSSGARILIYVVYVLCRTSPISDRVYVDRWTDIFGGSIPTMSADVDLRARGRQPRIAGTTQLSGMRLGCLAFRGFVMVL